MGGHSRDFIDSRNLKPGPQLASLGRSESAGELISQNSDYRIADSRVRMPLEQKAEGTDQLRGPAGPEALRQRAKQIETINVSDDSIAHDFNNVLQTAISSLDLVQVRVKQGRISEILPLIEKAQMALCRAGLMASAEPMDVRQLY